MRRDTRLMGSLVIKSWWSCRFRLGLKSNMVEFRLQVHRVELLDNSSREGSCALFCRASMAPCTKDSHRKSMKGFFYPILASRGRNQRFLCVLHHQSISFQVSNPDKPPHASEYDPKQSKFPKSRTLLVPLSFSSLFSVGEKAPLLGKLNIEKCTLKSEDEMMVSFKRKW